MSEREEGETHGGRSSGVRARALNISPLPSLRSAPQVAALEASNKATADRLAAALEALKAQVAAALAKHAAGGYGRAGADGLVSHLKKLGIDVDASPEALAALDAAPARGPASRAVAERLARLTAKGRAKVEEERARAAAAAPRLELSVDASTWARQLRLVTDDPERIARSLAAGAARAVSAVGGPALAAAGLLMPAAAAAAAGGGGGATTPPPRRATATLPVPPAAAAAASSSRGGGRKAAIDAKPATTPAAPAPSATATVTVAGGGAGGGKAAAGAAPVKRRLLVLRAAAPAAAPAAARPSSHAVTTTPAKPSARPASPFDSLEAAARPVAAAGPATPRGASGFLPSFGGGMEEDDCRAIVPRG